MDSKEEVMRALGRIEGKLDEMSTAADTNRADVKSLFERVSKIERWQSWLKGAWAVIVAGFAYLAKGLYGK